MTPTTMETVETQLALPPAAAELVPAPAAPAAPLEEVAGPASFGDLPGMRKATILLVTLGEQASANIIKELSEEEVQTISKAITVAEPITSQEALEVLREFHQLVSARSYVVRGGMDYASRLLQNAFGPEMARRLLERVTQSITNETANFDSLQQAEPQQLANLVHAEHPQTIALILSHLKPAQAAAVLTSMPPEQRADLSKRMANLEQISPEIIGKIAHVIGVKLKSLGDLSRESYGGVRAVAEMLNHLDAHIRKDILGEMGQDDENLVERIRHLMFVFEDLLTVDAAGIRELLAAVDRRVLTVALKGTSEKLQNHIMQNMSHIGAQMLREDIDSLGPVRIKDVEAAQQKIIIVARSLEAKGILTLSGTRNEQYVF